MTATDPVKILCIEDNPVNWRLVQRLLTQAGNPMHWASDGLKGFEMALALKPADPALVQNLKVNVAAAERYLAYQRGKSSRRSPGKENGP